MSWVMVAVGVGNAANQYQAGVTANRMAGIEAGQAEWLATLENDRAAKEAGLIRRAGQRQAGEAKTAFAASGVKVDEGSAAEVQGEIIQNSEADAFQALLDGGRRARGMQVEAVGIRQRGRLAKAAGTVNAANSLLATGSNYLKASGWRSNGPGYSDTQRPAPIVNRDYKGP